MSRQPTSSASHQQLSRALISLAASGGSVPCGEPLAHELWTSDLAEERQLAASRCRVCPVLQECAAAADEAGEQWHVWGGSDRTLTSQRRKAHT